MITEGTTPTPPPAELTDLTTEIRVVATARTDMAALNEQLVAIRTLWNEQNKVLLDRITEQKEFVAMGEDRVRELTIAAYKLTGNKAPVPGVGIRETTKLDYTVPDALKWATEHKIALALDKKAFEGIAKQSPLDFVKSSIEVTATIATNLDAGGVKP